VSFFSKIFKVAAPILGGIFGGPAGAAAGAALSSAVSPARKVQQTIQPAAFAPSLGPLPNLSLTAPTVPVALSPQGAQIGRAFGATVADAGGACPVGFHLDKRTRSRCVRNRRMNPLNGRAAMRAIRRIKGARKMLQKIERQLPRAKARRVPAHGHQVRVRST